MKSKEERLGPYIITKKKLTKMELKLRRLKYDGWGRKVDPSGTTDFYYVRKKDG